LETAEYYLRRAENVRAEAEKISFQHIRQQFLRIAEQYEELAAMIQQHERLKA